MTKDNTMAKVTIQFPEQEPIDIEIPDDIVSSIVEFANQSGMSLDVIIAEALHKYSTNTLPEALRNYVKDYIWYP
jgi:hypothetical protein